MAKTNISILKKLIKKNEEIHALAHRNPEFTTVYSTSWLQHSGTLGNINCGRNAMQLEVVTYAQR